MKQFKCEICGGTSIIQIDEKTYECQDCGLQYDVAEVEKLIVLPKVVEKLVELTVEEQKNSQPTFDVPQELEDNFTEEVEAEQETEEVEAEQETEEIAVETDSKTSPEYIEDTSIASAEDVETDNSTAIEEKPQSKAAEETADEISIIEPEVEKAEDVFSEYEDKSEETEVDEQEETAESSAIIPWYKNKKLIIPSIAGIALALIVVVLLIVLMPKENIPVSDNNSSDMSSDTSAVESDVSSENESIVESSQEGSVAESSEQSSKNSIANTPSSTPAANANADPNVAVRVETNNYNGGKWEIWYNAYGREIKEILYYDSGNIQEEHCNFFKNSQERSYSTTIYYSEDGTKQQYTKGYYDNKTPDYSETYYTDGIHKGKVFGINTITRTFAADGSIMSSRQDYTQYKYNENGTVKEIQKTAYVEGTGWEETKYELFDENGNKTYYFETDANGNVIKEIFYDESGNEIQS